MLALILLITTASAEESPPGLVSQDSDQDLVAEATQSGAQAQKRDAGLSNSYGEPLPPDAYGPPSNIPSAPEQPAPVYGVPDAPGFQDTPPGAYGPPSPVVFPNQNYEGPPPPIGKPKPVYGPPKFHSPSKPKQTYGPPKPIYGPPKKNYGPPKQSLPKPTYGVPFKISKIPSKPVYGVPKPIYGAPRPVYGPPKATYGPPQINIQNVQLPEIPISFPQNFGSFGNAGTGFSTISTASNFGTLETSVGTSIGTNLDLGLNLPAPIYGTPISSLPVNLKPNFPIPSDTYGPPGLPLGPIGPNDQVVVQDFGSIGHYGPPQPDPNPRPPHPGIPAPPTPPHVLYDGWKPIPGVSKPLIENVDNVHTIQSIQNIENNGHIEILDQYGPPPPPVQEISINLDGHSLPNINNQQQFSGAQISTGYSSVHQDALGNIDLSAIIGGESNHIDQSKTVFEAHYTENNNPQADLAFIANIPDKPIDSYGAPPLDSLSNGPYPPSIRQQGAKGLSPPAPIYGLPVPSNQYGGPKLPVNLPIPYGSVSGGGHFNHNGVHTPRHPIKFRESVPEGLIQQIGQISHHKDAHGIDHIKQGPAYLPPPIREVKDINQHHSSQHSNQHHSSEHGNQHHSSQNINQHYSSQHNNQYHSSQHGNQNFNSLSLSIEPTNLYSLPHAGQPLNFQHGQNQPSNLYGSPIDSYSSPLLTVGDHTASGSSSNAVAATLDGTILANLSNLEAAAILKHCPYHEAILKAARLGEKIPPELASSYVASLSSLGSTFHKNHQAFISQNDINSQVSGSDSTSYNAKDQSTASQNLVQTVQPNQIESEKSVRSSAQKGKSINIKDFYKSNSLQLVSDQIYETSEKIKNLSEEAKELQQKIVKANQNLNKNSQTFIQSEIPVKGNQATYTLQIQSANDGKGNPSIPHEQLLSEGLLQSILQAIEQPTNQGKSSEIYQSNGQNQNKNSDIYQLNSQSQVKNNDIFQSNSQNQIKNSDIYQSNIQNQFKSSEYQTNNQNLNYQSFYTDGLVLPAGYEPIDRSKFDQAVQSSNDFKQVAKKEVNHKHSFHSDCDLRADNSVTHTIVVPPPNVDKIQSVDEVEDNDVAIYFGQNNDKDETITEISVATSISEDTDHKAPEFGDKIKKS